MKRQEVASTNEVYAKKIKDGGVDELNDIEPEALKELQLVQSRLLELDDECVKEQLKIQRKFAARMRPLMLERQSVMDKIPNFWGRVMSNLPLDEDHILCSEDAELLSELQMVDLDDNIDDRGSYKLTLRFGPKAAEYFKPNVIEKLVVFDTKESGEPTTTCTKIEWVNGKNIVEKVQARRRKAQEGDGDEELEFSLFEWFTDVADEDSIQLGEIIRRQVWQNPLLFLYDGFGDESDEEDDEDEEE